MNDDDYDQGDDDENVDVGEGSVNSENFNIGNRILN